MLVLGVETSTESTSLGIIENNSPLIEINSFTPFTHSEKINILLKNIFEVIDIGFKDLKLLAVSIGPGYFTALRVGLSFVKAIEFVHKIPVVGVITLDALAHETPFCRGNLKVIPIIDAQKGQVYTVTYHCKGNKLERVTDYSIVSPADIEFDAETVFIGAGKGAEFFKDSNVILKKSPSSLTIAKLGLEKYLKSGADDVTLLEPFYLRITDAEARFGETDKTYPISG